MEMSEFILKVFTIIVVLIGALGMIVQSASFEGSVRTNELIRSSIDFSQSILSAPCLVVMKEGEIRKGLFDVEKLDSLVYEDFCLTSKFRYMIEIQDGQNDKKWKFGENLDDVNKVIYSVALRYNDKKINRGSLILHVEIV